MWNILEKLIIMLQFQFRIRKNLSPIILARLYSSSETLQYQFNPIPTSHGRNQPIYECHVTTAGRVKFLQETQNLALADWCVLLTSINNQFRNCKYIIFWPIKLFLNCKICSDWTKVHTFQIGGIFFVFFTFSKVLINLTFDVIMHF